MLDLRAVGQGDAQGDLGDLEGAAEDVAEAPVVVARPRIARERAVAPAGERRVAAEALGAQAGVDAPAPVEAIAEEAVTPSDCGLGGVPAKGKAVRPAS